MRTRNELAIKKDFVQDYSQYFDEDELEDLKEASEEHVAMLKSGAKEAVHAKKYAGSPNDVYHRIKLDVLRYLRENNIIFPLSFKSNCLWYMATHPDRVASWKDFVLEHL